MKRMLAAIIALSLLMSGLSVVAETEPSKAAVIIDGVRAAFFDADDNYLPPVERDGRVYVPADALIENLGLDATVDPDTLAVTVKGVRAAFFDADGNMLPAVTVDGNVYVPLAAFCETAGIPCETDGNNFTLYRPENAPVGDAKKDEDPEYYRIQLNQDNFDDYFNFNVYGNNFKSWEESYTLGGGSVVFQYYSLDCELTCNIKRNYDFGDVTFSVSAGPNINYGGSYVRSIFFHSMSMPPSGELRQSKHEEYSYLGYIAMVSRVDDIIQTVTVSSVSGYIMVPANEIKETLDRSYSIAMDNFKQGKYELALETLKELRDSGYPVDQEVLQKAQDEADRADYEAAKAFIDAGQYDDAIAKLNPLATEDYEDSAALLIQARDGKLNAIYQMAVALENDGKYEEAIGQYLACDGYADSAERIKACEDGLYGESYAEAEALEGQLRYDEAIAIYETLDGYRDSPSRIERLKSRRADKLAAGFNEGCALIMQDGKWGYIDTKGDIVIPCVYTDASKFSEGLAPVWKSGTANTWPSEIGFINSKGEAVIPFGKYSNAGSFHDGLAVVIANNKRGFIDKTGELVIPAIYNVTSDAFDEGYGIALQDKKLGYIDTEGNFAIEPQYDSANLFSEGLAAVKKDKGGKVGYIDRSGQMVIDYTFDEASDFSEGLAFVTVNGMKFFIDSQGKLKLRIADYEKVGNFHDGRALVKKNGKWGAIDCEGNVVIPFEYSDFQSGAYSGFQEGSLAVKKGDRWGVIDVDGNEIIPIQYANAYPYNEGYCLVQQGDYFGVFDREGNLVS